MGSTAAGARVALTSRDAAASAAVAASLGDGHLGLAMDVRSTGAVDAAAATIAETLGTPTILVNNAGVNRIGASELLTDEDWELVIDTDLTGVYRCCRAFGSLMLEAASARSSTSARSSERSSACRAGRRTVPPRQGSSG